MRNVSQPGWITTIPWWKRFKFQITVFSIIMAVVPLTLLGWYNLTVARQNLLMMVTRDHEQNVVRVANDMTSLLHNLQDALGVFVSTEGSRVKSLTADARTSLLYATLSRLPDVEDLSIYDEEGVQLSRVSRLNVYDANDQGTQLGENERKALTEHQRFIGPVTTDQNGQPRFQLFIPFVPGPKQEPTGGILATISLRNIVDNISKVSTGYGGYIFLVDEQGRLIGHEDFSQVLHQRDVRTSLPSQSLVKQAEETGNPITRTYTSYTGREVIGSFVPVGETEWAVIAEQPLTDALLPLRQMMQTFSLAAGGLILAVLSIGLYFGRHLSSVAEGLEDGIMRVADGEVGYQVSGSRTDELGQVVKAFNYLSQELYEKRKIEAVIHQADRMASVGVLAAGVAHEVNNPLATISISVEDLLDRLSVESAEALYQSGELITYLKAVQEQAQRCAEITGGLLDFARQREGTVGSFQVADLISKTMSYLHYRFKKQEIKLELLIPELPPFVMDHPGLQQVLFNLCLNAIDAMPHGGFLTIQVKQSVKSLIICISDTGTGIPEEVLPRVFDPFFTTKEPSQGTGLGLSVCYGIIARNGGDIKIQSQLGQGTDVTIELPVRELINGGEVE